MQERKYHVGEETGKNKKKIKVSNGFRSERNVPEPRLNLDMINLILRPEKSKNVDKKKKKREIVNLFINFK